MSIKNIGNFQQTLGNADANGWVRKADSGISDNFGTMETPGIENAGEAKSFGDFLKDSIGSVNKLQVDANVAMEKLASGESKNLHETLLTVEKADLAFKTMNQIRSKVIEAYKEVMRMQI